MLNKTTNVIAVLITTITFANNINIINNITIYSNNFNHRSR